ncbi:hypothetical protein [Paenibacillus sp. NPDC055715]
MENAPLSAALYAEGILDNTDVKPSVPLTQNNAIRIAVKVAGLTELAATYPANKAQGSNSMEALRLLP